MRPEATACPRRGPPREGMALTEWLTDPLG